MHACNRGSLQRYKIHNVLYTLTLLISRSSRIQALQCRRLTDQSSTLTSPSMLRLPMLDAPGFIASHSRSLSHTPALV